MGKKRFLKKILPFTCTALLVLTACSNGSPDSSQTEQGSPGSLVAAVMAAKSEEKSADVSEEQTEQQTEQATEEPRINTMPAIDAPMVSRESMMQGGTLRMAIWNWPNHWNMLTLNGNTGDNTKMYNFASPINWIYDEKGNFEPNPNFLESYELKNAEGDEKQVVTLNLNPKGVWNDGKPIDVEDYIAVWKACSGQVEEVACASSDGWNEIESIEAGESNFQVVVTYSDPYPDWSANMSTVQHADGVKDAASFEKGWDNPVEFSAKWTTGPFKFTKADQAGGLITLEKNDMWWGPEAMLDTVSFRIIESTGAQAQAFANKELDVVEPIISADNYETVKTREDAELKIASSVQWRHYTLNSNAGALKDQKVRQAIQHAIDRVAVATGDMEGLPVDPDRLLLGNHFFMPFQDGYQDNSVDYDPEKSKELLKEAGYTFNEDSQMFEKDGAPLTVKYLRMPDIPTSNNEGLVLQDNLKQVGIDLQFTDIERGKFFDPVITGEYEICSFTWVGTRYPMANISQVYGDPATDNSNFAQLQIYKVDDLVPLINREMDIEERQRLTNEVDEAIWEAVHTIPIFNRAVIVAQPESLVNYGSAAFATFLPENIGYKK